MFLPAVFLTVRPGRHPQYQPSQLHVHPSMAPDHWSFELQGWKGPEPVRVAWVLLPPPGKRAHQPGLRALHGWPVATSTSCPSTSCPCKVTSNLCGPGSGPHNSQKLAFVPSLSLGPGLLPVQDISFPSHSTARSVPRQMILQASPWCICGGPPRQIAGACSWVGGQSPEQEWGRQWTRWGEEETCICTHKTSFLFFGPVGGVVGTSRGIFFLLFF